MAYARQPSIISSASNPGIYLKDNNSLLFWSPLVFDAIGALLRARLFTRISSAAASQFDDETLFGINIAPSADPACDDYIVERLQTLGIAHVRMNYSYASVGSDAQRLLERVLAANKDVLIFPPAEEARQILHSGKAAQRWRSFVAAVIDEYSARVTLFEIGSTPNRGSWSGFCHRGYLKTWHIASEVATARKVALAGPNISDFEPVFNLAFLAAMKRYSHLPQVHTDNLFVERVLEPEAYDHRALGRWLEKPLALNLIRKARILQEIGHRFGVDRTWCTYTCWTHKRLDRKATDPLQKQVDYLVRYCVLAAASGSLERVYWGPMICSRDGVIDCGANGYPAVDNVSFYKEIRGDRFAFEIKPAFYALRHIVACLTNSRCDQGVNAMNGIHHFVFTREEAEQHIVWCRDGQTFLLNQLYPQAALIQAQISNAIGEPLDYVPEVISEQPLFISFAVKHGAHRPTAEQIRSIPRSGDLMQSTTGQQAVPVQLAQWRGAIMLNNGANLQEVTAQLAPEQLTAQPVGRVLRDTRNRLWTIADPSASAEYADGEAEQLVVKLNRAKGMKRFTYRFLPSKGQRHWNNASYMRRCGINTPLPVAYFERYQNSGIEENYYVCRYVADAFSARDVFTCFNQGNASFRGFSKDDMFGAIAGFIRNMHAQRIIHRDLSSGNLMMKISAAGEIEVFVIDIGRASVGVKERLTPRQRFIDLMRICYKLDWDDRELFVAHYARQLDPRAIRGWRLPLFFYEAKQTIKKKIKGKRKRKAK